jgi:transcriptional regulator with XRE-family HTH domain
LKQKISNWIKANREKAELSQQQLADKLGVSQPLISQWESGGVEPNHEMLEKLSAVLEVDLEETPFGLDLGEWLRRQREKNGLSREDLARKAKVSPLTIYFIENGTTKSPQKATLQGLQEVLGKLPGNVSEDVEELREFGDFEYLGPFPIDKWKENMSEGRIPCIYVFYDSLNRPVRIGETEDLERRIRDYLQMYWFRPPTAETFAYIVVKDPKVRTQIEKIMIKLVGEHAIFNIQDKI